MTSPPPVYGRGSMDWFAQAMPTMPTAPQPPLPFGFPMPPPVLPMWPGVPPVGPLPPMPPSVPMVDMAYKSRVAAAEALSKFSVAEESRNVAGQAVSDEARAAAVAGAEATAARQAAKVAEHVVAEQRAEATAARLWKSGKDTGVPTEAEGDGAAAAAEDDATGTAAALAASAGGSSSSTAGAALAPISEQRYTGVIKAFNTAHGYGFILCQDILKTYGCDVFLNQAVEGGIVIGGVVSFVLYWKNGRPQARDVILEAAPTAKDEAAKQKERMEELDKVHHGRVKSFNSSRGFGFLACPDLSNKFGGRDIFISRAQVPGGVLQPGQEISFRVALDFKGQPQARSIEFTGDTLEVPTAAGPEASVPVGTMKIV